MAKRPRPLPGEDDRAYVTRLAREHLPPDVAEEWLALLRPAVRLVRAWGEWVDAPVVARLGGVPLLPPDVPWPEWEGPLEYVGELHCDALAAYDLDVALPRDGRLLFFHFYDDDSETYVASWVPGAAAGVRVLYVPAGAAAEPRTPPGRTYAEATMAGQAIVTYPNWEHPARVAAADDELTDLLDARLGATHQVGGWADPVQGPVEPEAAALVTDGDLPWREWTLLLQVDSEDNDVEFEWEDAGVAYWVARYDDVARGDFTRVGYTLQGC